MASVIDADPLTTVQTFELGMKWPALATALMDVLKPERTAVDPEGVVVQLTPWTVKMKYPEGSPPVARMVASAEVKTTVVDWLFGLAIEAVPLTTFHPPVAGHVQGATGDALIGVAAPEITDTLPEGLVPQFTPSTVSMYLEVFGVPGFVQVANRHTTAAVAKTRTAEIGWTLLCMFLTVFTPRRFRSV